jgi:radical SAM protein with 4Fe4S-binding SPASM domain
LGCSGSSGNGSGGDYAFGTLKERWLLRGVTRTSPRSLFNSALNELERRMGRTYLRSNPDLLHLEPTTACNLDCIMCGRASAWSELAEHSAHMTKGTFRKAIPFLKTARRVVLHGWGEPLLAPNFTWMVETAKKCGCWVDFDTNGLLLKPKLCDRLVAAKIDCVNVSIDAATEETFKFIRGGDFPLLISNLERLKAAKEASGSPYPRVRFKFVIMRKNVEELPELVELAHRLGVSQIVLQNLIVWPNQGNLMEQAVYDQKDRVMELYRQAAEAAERHGIILDYWGDGLEEMDEAKGNCPFRNFTIMADGSVGPCGAQKYIWGNINNTPLRDLWNSPLYQEMRHQFHTKEFPSICEHCPGLKNAPEDHLEPDMSYVGETLQLRSWDMCER